MLEVQHLWAVPSKLFSELEVPSAPLGKPCGDAYATADAAEPPQKPLLQKAPPGELLGNGGSSQSPDEASPAVLEAKSAKSRSAPGALRCSSCHIRSP